MFDLKIMVKNIKKKREKTKKKVRGNPPDSWTEEQKEGHLGVRDRRLVTSVPLCGT